MCYSQKYEREMFKDSIVPGLFGKEKEPMLYRKLKPCRISNDRE